MKRDILIHPDPLLRKVASPVPEVTDKLRSLADDMLETMYAAPGIGLAAPQIGVLSRLIVLDCSWGRREGDLEEPEDEPGSGPGPGQSEPGPIVMFNPEVISESEETGAHEEGCLSIPEHFAEVVRPLEVEVRWLDLEGNTREEAFDGLWSVCVQHEIDHLDGKLFIDRIGRLKRDMITRKMRKLKREKARDGVGERRD